MKLTKILVVGSLLVALVGCGKSDAEPTAEESGTEPAVESSGTSLAGDWTGTIEVSDADRQMMAEQEPDMDIDAMVKMAESMQPSFELRDDGTYTMTVMGQDFDDTWILEGDQLTLASTGFTQGSSTGGVAVGNGEPMVLTLSSDGTLFTQDPSGMMTSKILYTRN